MLSNLGTLFSAWKRTPRAIRGDSWCAAWARAFSALRAVVSVGLLVK
jgi:hypothetical protein